VTRLPEALARRECKHKLTVEPVKPPQAVVYAIPDSEPIEAATRLGRGLYPIRTVSALTGVNPVTLRAWERRHGLLRPQRTAKGHRLYSDDDIARVRQVIDLQGRGVSISQIGHVLARPADQAQAQAALSASRTIETRWHRALASLDVQALEEACAMTLSLYPADLVCTTFMKPLLRKLATEALDDANSAARYQVLRMFVRNKLCARLHQDSRLAAGPCLLTALTTDARDELDLLFTAVALQSHGYRVIHLGGPIDTQTICAALALSAAHGLLLDSGACGPDAAFVERLRDTGLTLFGLGVRARNGKWVELQQRSGPGRLVLVDPDDMDRLPELIQDHLPAPNSAAGRTMRQ
jgi:MerR family transcriptional regulator, light-induced transcriptional regulator